MIPATEIIRSLQIDSWWTNLVEVGLINVTYFGFGEYLYSMKSRKIVRSGELTVGLNHNCSKLT